MTVLADLRDLMKKATPAPWEAEQETYDDGSGPWRIDAGKELVVDTGGYDGWFKGGFETEADAALVVGLRNAAENLLACAEAAQRCMPYVETDAFSGPNVEAHDARDALREALGRLS